MTIEDLKILVKKIVAEANEFKKLVIEEDAPVNYACIFCHNKKEFMLFSRLVKDMGGKVLIQTLAWPIFQISPLSTVAGDLQILKIRKPDKKRKERWDADFSLNNYELFKKKHIEKPWFKLIKRENFEMIEVIDSRFDVLLYFSHPPLDLQFNLV